MTPRRRLGVVSLDLLGAGVAVLTLLGEFHHREARDLEHAIGEALSGGHRHLLIDMRGVTLLGTAGLRVRVRGSINARSAGMGFALARPGPEVWETFELTGLAGKLPNAASLEEAVAMLPQS
jgi:anti-anti-sigma factor